jgi:Ca2+-binding RTX toxin-like protein
MTVVTLYDAEYPTTSNVPATLNADVIALAGGAYAATWLSDTGDGDGQCIIMQVYAADGTPTGAEVVVNTTVTGSQTSPEMTQLSDGRFILVWASADTADGSSGCIRARIFNADGSPAGADFVVNTTGTGAQSAPEVAALGNGGFMITWTSADTGDGSSGCVRGREYDATGASVGNDFIVNTFTSGTQSAPEMLELANGGVLVAWSSGQFRFYESDGDPAASGQLFAATNSNSRPKAMTELSDGRIAIAFESLNTNLVHVQIINSDGSLSGSVINVPVAAEGTTFANSPQIVSLANGGFVVFWDQTTVAGTIQDFKMRAYNADGSPATDEIVVAHSDTGGIGFSSATVLANGNILVFYNTNGSADLLSREIAITAGSAGTAFADIIDGGASADTLQGQDGADTLRGLGGTDTLEGGEGNDTLIGGTGNDTLRGGAGDDSFRFALGDGHDTIEGFTTGAGEDKIFVTGFLHYTKVQEGADLRIVFDANNSILIKNTLLADFTASDINITQEGELVLIEGTGGNDDLEGSALEDHMLGLAGDDLLQGLASNDLIEGGDGADVLEGGEGNDVISGGRHYDRLYGEEGDDVLMGGDGDDYISGGDGVDTVSYELARGAVSVDLSDTQGTQTVGAGMDYFIGVENLVGSSYGDALGGDDGVNRIEGRDGEDIIDGDEGDDVLVGGAGADTFVYRRGGENDTIEDFTVGADHIEVHGYSHYQKVQEGADLRLVFDTGETILLKNMTAAAFTAGSINILEGAPNIITGSGAGVTHDGTALPDVINALGGNDTLNGLDGADTLWGGDGDDTISGGADWDVITGDAGADNIDGGSGDDVILGGDANDVIQGGDGDDEIRGGAGEDTIAGGDGDDLLLGDTSFGGGDPGDGNDLFIGGAGADEMYGGGGTDTVSYEASTSGVSLNLDSFPERGTGDAEGDRFNSIEHFRLTDFDDVLSGNEVSEAWGLGGNDILEGGTLHGGEGDDILRGSNLDGGDGIDLADYSLRSEAITVDLSLGLQANGSTVTGMENVTGTRFADSITGDAGDNIITGGRGADALDGGGGDNTFVFAAGDGIDTIANFVAGGTDDRLQVSGFESFVLVQEGADLRVVFDATNSVLLLGVNINDFTASDINIAERVVSTGSEIDQEFPGTSEIDEIFGLGGIDILHGLEGNDILEGGTGNDTLHGGAGDDLFRFNAGDGHDTITDFFPGGDDRIQVTGYNSVTLVQEGDDLRLVFDANNSILLSEVLLANFTQADINIPIAVANGFYAAPAGGAINGTEGDDYIYLGTGNDTGGAGGGNDTIVMRGGIDNFTGGDGDDYFILIGPTGGSINAGLGGIDTLDASQLGFSFQSNGSAASMGAMTLVFGDFENYIGTEFDDQIRGNVYNNVIAGGEGDDYLRGGTGIDTVDYTSATNGVTVSLNHWLSSQDTGQGWDNIEEFENIRGSEFDDLLIGNQYNNVLEGRGGNDRMQGDVGNDTLNGGAGTGDTADYSLAAGGVTVSLALAGQQNTVSDGNDTLIGIENLWGSDFADALTGDGAANTLLGNAGNDVLRGGAGSDTFDGGAGNDTFLINAGDGADTIYGFTAGGAEDQIVVTGYSYYSVQQLGPHLLLTFDGGAGSIIVRDTLAANFTSADINKALIGPRHGGDGNDVLEGGKRQRHADRRLGNQRPSRLPPGGLGRDREPVDPDCPEHRLGAGSDTLSGIEQVLGSAFNDTLTGDGRRQHLGRKGRQRHAERRGRRRHPDRRAGADAMNGGGDLDYASYVNATAGVGLNLTTGVHTGEAAGDTFVNIERYRLSAFNDSFVGTAATDYAYGAEGDDTLSGAGGIDRLYGQAGIDTLNGDAGNDILLGGAGADIFNGGRDRDTASYEESTIAITMNLATGVHTGDAAGDTFTSIEIFWLSAFTPTPSRARPGSTRCAGPTATTR